MLHTKFQSSERSSSEEEDFLNIFLGISMLQTQDPWGGTILNPGAFICTNCVKDYRKNFKYWDTQTSYRSCPYYKTV